MRSSFLTVLTAAGLLVLGPGPAAADTWPTYSEIGTTLQNYENTYPSLCKRYDLGTTPGGRHLWAMRISDNVLVEEDEPEFKYISTMHGDEIVGVKMCMNLIDYLLTNYGTVPRVTNIVNGIELWIVPLMNPDGYDRSPRSRYNNNGVDLNRNFPEGSDGDPNTTTGRQPETAAIMNWSFGRSFTCSANFHGGAMVTNYPYDDDNLPSGTYAPTPDDDLFIYISEQYSYYNTPMWNGAWYHGITNGVEWYEVSGGMQDWNYRYMGDNEVTIELGDNKQPSASEIPTLWTNNRDSMLAYVETCLIGVRGIVTDGVTGLPLSATVTVSGRNHNVYTDPDVGDYHRMLKPGTYTLVFSATGYDPVTVSSVVVSSGAATQLNIQMFGPTYLVAPNGGETLTSGEPTTISWTGNPSAQYQVQDTENYGAVGVVTDDFERTELGSAYTTGGNALWFIASGIYHSATRSARAGDIGDSQVSWMTRTATGGSLSFWYRVRSELNYDWFNFTVDGVNKIHKSGSMTSFSQYTTTLAAGNHTLKWEYVKDQNTTYYEDTVWIDDLQLTGDATTWTDIVALTAPGTTSVPWTPTNPGTSYKVRVRSYYLGSYGAWDESNATFTVVLPAADGDYDNDGDVDLVDFGALQGCYVASPSWDCRYPFDNDHDGDVDLADFAQFIPLLEGSGPGM